jgi:hypothetical protein
VWCVALQGDLVSFNGFSDKELKGHPGFLSMPDDPITACRTKGAGLLSVIHSTKIS